MTARQDSATTWEHRYDRGALLSAQDGPAGTLLVEGFAAREGVLEYRTADGRMRREFVPAETLRRAAGGLGRAPVTLEHPPEDVTPDNFDRYGVGDTDGEVAIERGGFVRVKMAVRRKDAIAAVRAGKQELSPGYRVRIDPTPGEHPVYGRYDCVQVEREYNHLAIVDQARGGVEVRLRADAAYSTETISGATPNAGNSTSAATHTTHTGSTPRGAHVNPGFLPVLTLLGISQRVDSDAAALEIIASKLRERNDSANTAEQQLRAQLATLTTERDQAVARADAADAKATRLEAAEAARADAAAKAELESLAKSFGVDVTKHNDAKGLRRAIASAVLGSEVRADASDVYLDAMIDLAKARGAQTRGDGREAGRQAWQPPAGTPPPTRNDSSRNDASDIDWFEVIRRDSAAAGGER